MFIVSRDKRARHSLSVMYMSEFHAFEISFYPLLIEKKNVIDVKIPVAIVTQRL